MELKVVKVSQIAQNPVALRNVDRQSEGFLGLKDSIAKQGVINPISIRPSKAGSEKPYELIDGLHRFIAACEAGLSEIPAQIIPVTDAQALEVQIIANIHQIKTKPVEYAKQIQRILTFKPLLTISELSASLAVSPTYLNDRLGLLKLDPKIAELVDNNKINLTNAYALAKLPQNEQKNYVQAATTQAPAEFVPAINARCKEIREALRTGKEPAKQEFEPIARIRKRSELVEELANPKVIKVIVKGAKNIEDAAYRVLQWTLHMDADSIQIAKAKFDQKVKELEAAKAKRKAEREAQKSKDGATAQASVS
jgi:ParB/RepB/Spo0J family partition protein